MAYQLIEDFAAGVDLRKSAVTAKPGTLRRLENGLVTAGGEIAKREAFSLVGTLNPGTHGLSFDGGFLVVFGTDDQSAVDPLPPWTRYEKLVPTAPGGTIARVLDAEFMGGKHFVAVEWSDGSVKRFYDGAELTDTQQGGTNFSVHKGKMFGVDGPNLRFSAISDPTDWGDGAGAGSGIIDVTEQDTDATALIGMAEYFGQLALFGRKSVQIWAMDPDPALSQRMQTLGNIGLLAPHAAARHGSGDVLFLSDTGIRSLRARNSSNAASLGDVGSPVDPLIVAKRLEMDAGTRANIRAVVDPLTGRYWLVWGRDVFVLSHYPDAKISAWSTFSLPADVAGLAVANSRLVLRQGDNLLMYGSHPDQGINPFDPDAPTGVQVYDASTCVVETPFMDVGSPAAEKHWTGLDLSVQGAWDVYVNPDYRTPDGGRWTKVAAAADPTWSVGRVPLDMRSTHIAIRLETTGDTAASLASMALHYSMGESA